jgi:hypothetical protein
MKKNRILILFLLISIFVQAPLRATFQYYETPINLKEVKVLVNTEPKPTLKDFVDKQKNEIVKGIFNTTMFMIIVPLTILASIASSQAKKCAGH